MNRADFERRLREDPDLRERLDVLQETAVLVHQTTKLLDELRQMMFRQIAKLAEEGVPQSSLARVVDLTSQRMSQIVREYEKAEQELAHIEADQELARELADHLKKIVQNVEEQLAKQEVPR